MATVFKTELSHFGRLLHCPNDRASLSYDQTLGTDYPRRTTVFREPAMNYYLARACDLAAFQHSIRTNDEMRSIAERDRALLKTALYLHKRLLTKLERGVAQDIP